MSFLLGPNEVIRGGANFLRYRDVPQDENIASYLGTPIYDQLRFSKDFNPELELSEDLVINDVLFTCRRPKNIVRTKVQGRDGDVNEFISNADWEITINGMLVSEDQLVQPKEDLITLRNIINYEGSIALVSDYLQSIDVDTIVIDSADINQVPGTRNVLPFVLQCRSEDAIELQIQSSTNASA